MGAYFPKSSGLVKRYAAEVGAGWVQSMVDPSAGHGLFVVRVAAVEVAAALFRRVREGTMNLADARAAVFCLKEHMVRVYQQLGRRGY